MNIPYKNISKSCLNSKSTKGYNFEFYNPEKNDSKKEKQKIHIQSKTLKILDKENNKVYPSIKKAAEETGKQRKTISSMIKRGERFFKVN